MGMLAGELFLYDFHYLARIPPQVWRLVTCFLITFPNLGVLFDTFHMYMYMSQLEKGHPRLSRREDLVWYLTFVCGTILVGLLVPTLLCSPVYPIYENPSKYLPG
jgi:Derlin-2/3